jgi:hypothetical protein
MMMKFMQPHIQFLILFNFSSSCYVSRRFNLSFALIYIRRSLIFNAQLYSALTLFAMLTNSISCNWLGPTDVVTDIQTLELNTTDIVSQCANICPFIFQSHNLVRKTSIQSVLNT